MVDAEGEAFAVEFPFQFTRRLAGLNQGLHKVEVPAALFEAAGFARKLAAGGKRRGKGQPHEIGIAAGEIEDRGQDLLQLLRRGATARGSLERIHLSIG